MPENRPYIRELEDPGTNARRLRFYTRLSEFEDGLIGGSFLDWCANAIAEGTSLRAVSARVKVSHSTLGTFLRNHEIATLSQTEAARQNLTSLRQNPEFNAITAAATREAALKKWDEPGFREKRSEQVKKQWEDPEFRRIVAQAGRQIAPQTIQNPAYEEKRLAGSRKAVAERWTDPEYRERETSRLRKLAQANWTNPGLRARMSQDMARKWQDPAFRTRHAERNRAEKLKMWQDPDYRAKMADASRRVAEERIRQGLLPVLSIHGLRKDLGFYALSTWEANLARVFEFLGWQYEPRVPFELQVPDELQKQYHIPKTTTFHVDFVTVNSQGNVRANEIMVHPGKIPRGLVKVELFTQQYSDLRLRLVSERYYNILEKRFRRLIDVDPRFCGWETYKDNLYSNPTKYAA